MKTWIALFRGINIIGNNRLPMKDLKRLLEKNACVDVKTYIQSGNVLFRSDEAEKTVEERLDEALGKTMGKRPGVMVRSHKELDGIVANAPFPDAKPNFMLVYFLPEKAPGDALATIVAPDGEEAKLAGREIYVHYPNGSGRSKLKLPALKTGTSRNLNTVRKLAEMAAAMEGKD
jgi:uncharacterized protein (DUF1697 family)